MSELSDAQDFVTKLKDAYAKVLAGTLKSAVRIGGTDFYTQITYVQPTASEIFTQLNHWKGIVASLTPPDTATNAVARFNTSNTIPLNVRS